jgi:hypothetical protein
MRTSELVLNQVHRLFGPSRAAEVVTALDQADLSLGLTNPDRVQLAILLLSHGDMDRFRDALRTARQDWRDTLIAAGLADDDWSEVLLRQGIDLSE